MNHTEGLEFIKTHNPDHYDFEEVNCYHCGKTDSERFLVGKEDLTGKPGKFLYVKCKSCDLVYQNPRLVIEQIKDFYDDEYIAHKKKNNFGVLTPLYNWAINKHDRDKEKIIRKYVKLDANSKVLDIGCAVGTFLQFLRNKYKCKISGVDFKDLSDHPEFNHIDFYHGVFYDQGITPQQFDLVTMWHFLEHCYDPKKSLVKAKEVLAPGGKLIVEVPRLDSVSYYLYREVWPGVQAPQHTILFDKKSFCKFIEESGFEIEEYLPYGAFPPYFYLFAGLAFKFLKGKGMKLQKILAPYFVGQLLLTPVLLFSKHLNLSMQTIVCKKK